MAQLPRPHPEDAAATALRARLMREDARCARERNQQLAKANEELLARVRARRAKPAAPPHRSGGRDDVE
jgi:hypothetical protein